MGWKWTQVDISRLRAAEMIFSSHMEGKTKTHPERERDKIKKNVYVDKLTNNKIRRYMDILKKYIETGLQRRLNMKLKGQCPTG
jgi:mevalonate pyrophosphate decarboxylase